MNSVKYVGLDVHQATISVAVLDARGKTGDAIGAGHAGGAILDFLRGCAERIHLTFEEGTHSAWLYDLLVRRVARVVVCNPRKNALLKAGNKSDTIDARKLAELLRAGLLSPVYHGENSTTTLQQLGRSYTALTEDTTRVKGRLKAVYRGQAIASAGKKLYGAAASRRVAGAVGEGGLRRRAELLYQELDALQALRREGAPGVDRRKPQARSGETAAYGSVSGSDPRGAAARKSANAASLPHQAAVLGLLRAGAGDAQQRRLPLPGWTTGAREQAGVHPRTEPEPQSRTEEPV